MTGRPALHVLGPSPAWPNPGEACASHVVQAGGARVLLDCGTGAVAELLARDPEPLDAVVISHLHFDHVADLIPFAYHLSYGALTAWEAPALWLPPGGRERTSQLALAGGAKADHLEARFRVREYDPAGGVDVRDARVSFAAVDHPGGCYAIRVEAEGAALCYSGDTGPDSALPRLAAGAGLLLCEAAEPDEEPEASDVHLRGGDAGRIAAAAGVARLVLTHVEAARRERAAAAAAAAFGGPVDIAVPGFRAAL